MRTVSKNRSRVNTHKCITRQKKPAVFVDVMPNGKLHIYGSSAAARYLGVSQQSFDRVVRRHYNPPRQPKTVYSVIAKVREAYPELFMNGDAK